ncbi:MAG: class II glutamine amidotransferase [Planctomycetes bacterium]|nr:class II glutamine amidotransferase [Planctomycetota bacterium]
MCELLGVSTDQAERPTFAMESLAWGSRDGHWTESSPHGWGVACFPDGRTAHVYKEPRPMRKSEFARQLRNGELPPSLIHLLHIRRKSTKGAPAEMINTHPFQRTVNGTDYVFAHNGGLSHAKTKLDIGNLTCDGDTTSERAFCHLLAHGETALRRHHWNRIQDILHKMNVLGKLNCMLSDGEYLLIYSDAQGYKRLQVLHRQPPFGVITMRNRDGVKVEIALSGKKSRRALLCATRATTSGEEWGSLEDGQLIVARKGEIVWQGN